MAEILPKSGRSPVGFRTRTFHLRPNGQEGPSATLVVRRNRRNPLWKDKDFHHVSLGIAICNSQDQFSRRIGRKIAMARLERDQFASEVCFRALEAPLQEYFSRLYCGPEEGLSQLWKEITTVLDQVDDVFDKDEQRAQGPKHKKSFWEELAKKFGRFSDLRNPF